MPSASAPSTVLLRSGDVTVTRADYDTELARLPENYRGAFGVEAQRVDALLGNLLVQKMLAAQARDAGIDRDPAMQRRITAEIDKLLAAERVARIEADARRVLQEGMVINVDIPFLDVGWGGMQLEDTVLVTKKGFKLLTNTERTLYLI